MIFKNKMFKNMIRLALGEKVISTSHSREEDDVVQDNTIIAAPHVIAKEAAISSAANDPELLALEGKFGKLESGRDIEISLQDLLVLIPRTRRRSDAYKGLTSKLKSIGVSLTISSRKGGAHEN